MSAGNPCTSILVPLTGGPAQALRCFEGIAALPATPAHEVVVIDNASAGLEPLLRQLAGDVQIVRSERRLSLAAAVQLGAETAQSETIVLIRGAAVPASDWLAPLSAAMNDDAVGMAASVNAAASHEPVPAAWACAIRRRELRDADLAGVDDHLLIPTLALRLAERGRLVKQVPESAILAPGARNAVARSAPGEAAELTIVIPTLDATSARMHNCLHAVSAATEAPHQIVIVDNGAPPQGFSAPVNAGLRAALTPYVVVMNDDVEPLPGWWGPLRAALDAGAAVAFPLTIDGVMRTDFAAWCFAMSRETVNTFGHGPGEFFDPSLVVWYQDTDLLMTLRRAGRPPVLVHGSTIRHGLSETVATEDPQLREWIRAQIEEDQRRFAAKQAEGSPALAAAG